MLGPTAWGPAGSIFRLPQLVPCNTRWNPHTTKIPSKNFYLYANNAFPTVISPSHRRKPLPGVVFRRTERFCLTSQSLFFLLLHWVGGRWRVSPNPTAIGKRVGEKTNHPLTEQGSNAPVWKNLTEPTVRQPTTDTDKPPDRSRLFRARFFNNPREVPEVSQINISIRALSLTVRSQGGRFCCWLSRSNVAPT